MTIIIGGGIIGLAIARELHRRGWKALVFDQAAAGGEASWAAAGMLAAFQTRHPGLRKLALASAALYPDFVRELERETYLDVGYRGGGTLYLEGEGHAAPQPPLEGWTALTPDAAAALEPGVRWQGAAWHIPGDHSVDNRRLTAALLAAARGRGIEIREHCRVRAVVAAPEGLRVETDAGAFAAASVVNAAGAWGAAMAAPWTPPLRPRKGQMLCLRTEENPVGRVIAAPGGYLVPRGDGRTVVGATVEDCGFDRATDPEALAGLHRFAAEVAPALAAAQVEESWAGLRPGAADDLPILGAAGAPGYWIAGGHFRDGILLAPVTAVRMAEALCGEGSLAEDCAPFSPLRFGA